MYGRRSFIKLYGVFRFFDRRQKLGGCMDFFQKKSRKLKRQHTYRGWCFNTQITTLHPPLVQTCVIQKIKLFLKRERNKKWYMNNVHFPKGERV